MVCITMPTYSLIEERLVLLAWSRQETWMCGGNCKHPLSNRAFIFFSSDVYVSPVHIKGRGGTSPK